jgi:hypothetical protein
VLGVRDQGLRVYAFSYLGAEALVGPGSRVRV